MLIYVPDRTIGTPLENFLKLLMRTISCIHTSYSRERLQRVSPSITKCSIWLVSETFFKFSENKLTERKKLINKNKRSVLLRLTENEFLIFSCNKELTGITI